MKKGLNILGLFDGLSVGQLALQDAGIKVNKYYSSEIDKYVIGITQYNFPDTIQLGDIKKWREWDIDWSGIDLIFGGFPCCSWSVSGKQLGDKDPRGQLMWDMLDIKKHIESLNPNVKFLFENVRMKKEFLAYINKAIGVQPVLLNSSRVSAQNRNRFFWTNIEGNDDSDLFQKKIGQPKDKHIYLKDILEKDVDDKYFLSDKMIKCITAGGTKNYKVSGVLNPDKSYTLLASMHKMHRLGIDTYVCCAMRGRHLVNGKRKDEKGANTKQMIEIRKDNKTNCLTTVQKDNLLIEKPIRIGHINKGGQGERIYDPQGKSVCLCALGGGFASKTGMYQIKSRIRKLTPIECERLQTLPDNFTAKGIMKGKVVDISNSRRYMACGNSWTKDVIVWILSHLKL